MEQLPQVHKDLPPVKFFAETLGFYPVGLRLKQAKIALFGEQDVPRSTFNLSSLKQLHPTISLPLWRGKSLITRKVIISNLFNHLQTPVEEGWSVGMTQTKDFRGKHLTYNSHNGSDFAIPVGSKVATAAAGVVVRISSEFNRGGLKVFIDHGQGLMTCYAHLARSLVKIGDVLKRGQTFAISGYSGLDGLITFPFGIPHVHFNVWLNGLPVDPFAFEDQVSLWRNGNQPIGVKENDEADSFTPSKYNAEKVDEAIETCKTESSKSRMLAIENLAERAAALITESNYYPTRFPKRIHVYDQVYPRTARLDLPFRAEDFDGIIFIDDLKRT